jgi:uncharacterized protein YdhG (YjbR/CyaY superfamily)
VDPNPIDEYLEGVAEPDRSALDRLRAQILDVVPDAQECISYGVPAFRVEGSVVAGFAAFQNHLSYFPFSGSVLVELEGELGARARTKSALHFSVTAPLSDELVAHLVRRRLAEVARRGR